MPYKSKESRTEYYRNNRKKFIEKQHNYYNLNKDDINKNRRERYKNDPVYAEKLKNIKKSSKCKHQKKVHDATYRINNKEKLKKYTERIPYRYSCTKSRAKKRGLDFDITLNEYEVLVSKKCFYCGQELGKYGIALDRVDNSKGYIFENVVPCCSICNVIKMDFSLETLLSHITLIYNRYKSGYLER